RPFCFFAVLESVKTHDPSGARVSTWRTPAMPPLLVTVMAAPSGAPPGAGGGGPPGPGLGGVDEGNPDDGEPEGGMGEVGVTVPVETPHPVRATKIRPATRSLADRGVFRTSAFSDVKSCRSITGHVAF